MEKQISSLIVRKHSIEYENAFESEMLESKLQFVYKILRKIEDNRESICNILKEDSNLTNKRFEYGSGSEKRELECLNLLKNVINNRGKNDIPKKELGKAYAFLGIAHEIGAFNLKVDFGKAHYNYILALRNGSGMGAFRLAVMYEKGTYEKKNFAKALLYYECAAKMGLAEGAHAYGMILYYTEDDKIHDYQTGFDFIKFAMVNATPEYPYPFFDLARIYEHGNSQISIPKDLKYSFKIYVHGASIGCPNCCYRLGRSFEYGELNRQRSWKDAIYWYKKAASYGQVDAQMALSTFYLTGIDRVLDINYEEAYKWTLKAAITGHAGAAYSLGGYIEQGIGIKKDSAHALWWYSISGLYGNKNAKYKIEQLSYKISKTPTKSKRWWQFCC
ncbi:Extracellular protein SEL-1 [Pseudoloma neurophilia]|uniref:Extracellular protein SEL-1 n=1 Tax=Pseudoloma neurophilia TaxID=146866 RepID=A0A0R0LW41_9MICR|nr:Extracellular protein SEL-1 [Pseudoloma neurophilia]